MTQRLWENMINNYVTSMTSGKTHGTGLEWRTAQTQHTGTTQKGLSVVERGCGSPVSRRNLTDLSVKVSAVHSCDWRQLDPKGPRNAELANTKSLLLGEMCD